MPLTLEQYADFLDTRGLDWPIAPPVRHVNAKPHLVALPHIRVVAWNLYGTLLHILSGELLFEHPQRFVMDLALEKTVQEFKMWGSMSRKPGQPSEYMGQMYSKVLTEQRLAPSPAEKHPEVVAERVWEGVIKKLLQKDYKFDAGFFGSLNELSRKVAYFFHASIQGTSCHDGAFESLSQVASCGIRQVILADAQCFSQVQLKRGLASQGLSQPLETLVDFGASALSCEMKAKKPSERLFRHILSACPGVAPEQILHVGSRIEQDLAPAKKLGMRTALFAGDKESVQATPEQLKDSATKPDVLLTRLIQIDQVVS